MVEQIIPDDVRDFILRHIDSVAYLEALLLLRGEPNETWDVRTTARRLYTPEAEIAELLERLREDGLLSGGQGLYRYDCASEQQRHTVDRLAAIYSRHLVSVTNVIHGKPRLRRFVDAFNFRKSR